MNDAKDLTFSERCVDPDEESEVQKSGVKTSISEPDLQKGFESTKRNVLREPGVNGDNRTIVKSAGPLSDRSAIRTAAGIANIPNSENEGRAKRGILLGSLDHLVRLGFRRCLEDSLEFRIEAEATGPDDLERLIAERPRELLVLDSAFYRNAKEEFVGHLNDKYPDLRVLLLCTDADSVVWLRAIEQGASCHLTTSKAVELVRALQEASSRHQYIDVNLQKSITSGTAGTFTRPLHLMLSGRERTVFRQVVLGKSTKEISNELNLSIKTVSTYKNRVLKKMQMRSTAELVAYALRQQILR